MSAKIYKQLDLTYSNFRGTLPLWRYGSDLCLLWPDRQNNGQNNHWSKKSSPTKSDLYLSINYPNSFKPDWWKDGHFELWISFAIIRENINFDMFWRKLLHLNPTLSLTLFLSLSLSLYLYLLLSHTHTNKHKMKGLLNFLKTHKFWLYYIRSYFTYFHTCFMLISGYFNLSKDKEWTRSSSPQVLEMETRWNMSNTCCHKYAIIWWFLL